MCLEFSTGAHSLGSLGAIGSICESCRTPKAAGSSIQRDPEIQEVIHWRKLSAQGERHVLTCDIPGCQI